jgi:hypothetical protein
MSKKLLDLVKRRHPKYAAKLPHWNFVEETYEGGRDWFTCNIFRYLKEGDQEYTGRIERAYRFNHTKQVVDLVDKYLFRQPIARKTEDVPEELVAFWKRATRSGLSVDAFMKRVSAATSKFGRVWICVDSNAKPDETNTKADEKAGDVQIYAYIIRPQDMLDMGYEETGELAWALVAEFSRDDGDPMNSSGEIRPRFRLWTTTDWKLFELQQIRGGGEKVVQIDKGDNSLGEVPIFSADHVFSDEPYDAPGLIDDIAYLDRANANYLSNLDAIIQDQTFSQLAMPAQGVLPGEKGYDKLVEMGTKRVFLYNGEAGKGPEWIAPDPRQAELILKAIMKIVNEIYHSVGLSGERTKDDNGGGVDNSSGVAKAYDFEKVNSLLTSKADALQIVERKLAYFVALYTGQEARVDEDNETVTYPREFDTRGLYDEFEIGARLTLLAAPDEVRRQQMLLVIKKLFPSVSDADMKKMEDSLKNWPPQDLLTLAGGKPGAATAELNAVGTQKTAKELAA